MELKSKFEKAAPMLEQLQIRVGSQDFEFLDKLCQMNATNCEVIVNVRNKSETSSGETTASYASEEDEEVHEEETTAMDEINWLKERMLELSDSLNLQSQCLRRLKCRSFAKLKEEVQEINEVLQDVKCKIIEKQETVNSKKYQDLGLLTNKVVALKTESCKLGRQLQEMKKELDAVKGDVIDRMCSLKTDMEGRMIEYMRSQSTSQDSSEIINTQNLQQSDSSQPEKCGQQTNRKCCSTPSCCSISKNYQTFSQQNCSSMNVNWCEPIVSPKCCPVPSECCPAQYGIYHRVTTEPMTGHFAPQCPCAETPESDCSFLQMDENQTRSSLAESLVNVQKQVSSHNFCLQQLIRDIAMKLDRCEFERCRRQLSETIDLVMKLKRDQLCPSLAAGCAIPLMRNVNCISCQTTTNMAIMANATVPLAEPLKFGRAGSETRNGSVRSQCQNMSRQNWTCYSRNSGRRAGGSHTKVSKTMQVNEMRFKRLKTPIKIISSIMVYKNRFRRANACC